jgi:hypothetical protein
MMRVYFVQKECAAFGFRNQATPGLASIGKSPRFMPEKFVLKQLSWNRAAIDRHKRAFGLRAEVMESAGA